MAALTHGLLCRALSRSGGGSGRALPGGVVPATPREALLRGAATKPRAGGVPWALPWWLARAGHLESPSLSCRASLGPEPGLKAGPKTTTSFKIYQIIGTSFWFWLPPCPLCYKCYIYRNYLCGPGVLLPAAGGPASGLPLPVGSEPFIQHFQLGQCATTAGGPANRMPVRAQATDRACSQRPRREISAAHSSPAACP